MFVPNNWAFRRTVALYPGLAEALVADPQGALTAVLAHHVFALGKVMSDDLPENEPTEIEMFSGETLTVTKTCSIGCRIELQHGSEETARVVWRDSQASNGVIHYIDYVLIPPSLATTAATFRAP